MKSLIQLFLVLMVFSCTTNAQQDLVFEGKGIQGQKVDILRFDFNKRTYTTVRSIQVGEEGTFSFKDSFKEPTFYRIKIDKKPPVRIAVEKAGPFLFSMTGEELRVQSKAGSIADFGKTMNEINEYYFADLKKEYEAAIEKQDMARLEVLEKQKDDLLPKFIAAMENAIRKMGPSAAAYEATTFLDSHKNFDFLAEMTTAFEKDLPKSHLTQFLKNQVDRAAKVQEGALPPSFTSTDLEGKKVNLSDYKGSYVLIDFWASWCLACRAENPKLVDLYQNMKEKGLSILSISQDEDEEAYKKALAKDQLTWKQVWDRDKSLSNLYLVSSLPANFLIDPAGKIIAKNITADQLESIMVSFVK